MYLIDCWNDYFDFGCSCMTPIATHLMLLFYGCFLVIEAQVRTVVFTVVFW